MIKIPRIYLAGGFHSTWQAKVKQACEAAGKSFLFIDPSTNGLRNPHNYTSWDMRGVELADIIFAYMQSSNPGGYATAAEVGYARGLGGKSIIFVDDFGPEDESRSRYFEMVRQMSDYKFTGLDRAIVFLVESFLDQ